MYIFDIENKSYLKDVLIDNLKTLGVRCRLPKKLKENDKENTYSNNQVFQKPLAFLKKSIVYRLNGSSLSIPEFIVDACGIIEKDIKVEGIFRKAGSTCKQKQRKLELNQGKKLTCEYHVLDACSLVKLFFRELPQPLIPFSYYDILLKCLMLPTYEKEVDALMLACLLLPEENLATLAFFMEFLLKVSWHSDRNKMNIKNLAIILTPTLMPLSKDTRAASSLEMAHHFKVIEMLIENAERIGQVPDPIIEKILDISYKKSKKKKRSGSITRMLTGLKKIVGSSSSSIVSEWDESINSTPDSLSSIRKRKNTDSCSSINLSAKKKRMSDFNVGALTPLRCRMHGYGSALHSTPSFTSTKRTCSQSPNNNRQDKASDSKTSKERGRPTTRTSRLNLVRRCTTKKQKPESKFINANNLGVLSNTERGKSSLERKLSVINWMNKKAPANDLLITESKKDFLQNTSDHAVDHSDNELITVHKSEYEEIKNRVSALEEDLELLATVHSVQFAYEKTLEESERLNEGSTEKLAKRLSKELKIRSSSENKVMRSPSARKIGSVRRRSRELVLRNSEPKSNLKRGRPNTVQTGLPSPRLRAISNDNLNSPKINQITRSSTFRGSKENWKSGDLFFSREHHLKKLTPAPQGRPSLAEIRCQNAGMVLEKAKLFNALNESNETKVPRRQSIRLENFKRMNDADASHKKMLTRTRSLVLDKKNAYSPLAESVAKVVISQGRKEGVCTPKSQNLPISTNGSKRETPSLKKSLVTRSPRTFAKTPMSHVRSTNRSRATPFKALPEPGGTPHIGLRRSPRVLARSLYTPRIVKE